MCVDVWRRIIGHAQQIYHLEIAVVFKRSSVTTSALHLDGTQLRQIAPKPKASCICIHGGACKVKALAMLGPVVSLVQKDADTGLVTI